MIEMSPEVKLLRALEKHEKRIAELEALIVRVALSDANKDVIALFDDDWAMIRELEGKTDE